MTMLGVTTVAGIAALCLSATANRQLLRQVGDDLHRFYAVPVEEFITKARHLSVLKDDATMLDGYYREGEPLRLGLGLYPGERIRQPVLRTIRDWRPPEQKMEVTASLQAQTVRLDSMSLFDVGQARLKDGSTKVLVDALVNIRAKPGWLTRRRLKQVPWMTFPVVCWDSSGWVFPAARTISPRRYPVFWPCSA